MRIFLALCLLSTPAIAFDNFRGGREGSEFVSTLYAREAEGWAISRDGGWYLSRDTVYVASPKACIVPNTDVQALFHAATDWRRTRGPIPSIWNGIVTGDSDSWYRSMMSRSPWGRRIYAEVLRRGWLDTPDYNTLSAPDLIRLGVPVCGR